MSSVRSDQAAQDFSQAHLKSLQGLTEPAQPLWATSTACLSSWGRMLHISRLNLSYLTLILPISTAVKSLAPSSQWSANANHPIACQVDFLACLQFIRNLFDSPWPFKDDRVALLRPSSIISAPLDAAQWVLWTYMGEVSSSNLLLNPSTVLRVPLPQPSTVVWDTSLVKTEAKQGTKYLSLI